MENKIDWNKVIKEWSNIDYSSFSKGFLAEWNKPKEEIPEGWKYYGETKYGTIIIEKL